DLGFTQANSVLAGLEPKRRPALVWHSAVIAAVGGGGIAVAGILALVLGVLGLDHLIRAPVWLYMVPMAFVPIAIVAEYWGEILRGMNRIRLLNSLEVGGRLASLLAVAVLVGWWRGGVPGAVWANSLPTLAMAFLLVWLLHRERILSRPVFDRSLWTRARAFALPVYLSRLVTFINYRVDQFIIAALLAPDELGYYVIAVGLAERLWILTGSAANVLLPHLANAERPQPELPAVVARHVFLWTGLATGVVFVFADALIRMLYSSEFAGAAPALRWLLPGILIATTGRILIAGLLAGERARELLTAATVGAVVNVVGNALLVPKMGITGAAATSAVSYSLWSALLTWYYLRSHHMSWDSLVPRRADFAAYGALFRRVVGTARGSAGGHVGHEHPRHIR